MLAARMPTILPPLSPEEALETSMIHSVAGILKDGKICFDRPYRDPHHTSSTPALVGGGRKGQPGEISLAHNGVLFLDELPEFSRRRLKPSANRWKTAASAFPRSRPHDFSVQISADCAMNPCRCGYLGTKEQECTRAPLCAEEYRAKISGPLLDRIDMHIEVPAVSPWDLANVKKVKAPNRFGIESLPPEHFKNNVLSKPDTPN